MLEASCRTLCTHEAYRIFEACVTFYTSKEVETDITEIRFGDRGRRHDCEVGAMVEKVGARSVSKQQGDFKGRKEGPG